MRYIHVEILGFSSSSAVLTQVIKVGDKVRVRPDVAVPKYKWGHVTHQSIGTVTAIGTNGPDVTVDFPEQAHWTGLLAEMQLVPQAHGTVRYMMSSTQIIGYNFACVMYIEQL